LQREGGPKLKLTQVTKDEYTLEAVPEARLKFVRDENGRIKELRVLNDRENGKYQNDSNSPLRF